MTEQLKPMPCPFCGHIGLQFESGSTYRWGIASCAGCGATCGEVRRNYPDDGKWHAEAIKEWNRRAQPAQAVPVLTDEEIDAAEIAGGNSYRKWNMSKIGGQMLMPQDSFQWHISRAIEAALIAKWSKT